MELRQDGRWYEDGASSPQTGRHQEATPQSRRPHPDKLDEKSFSLTVKLNCQEILTSANTMRLVVECGFLP